MQSKRPQARAKDWGREVENAACKTLGAIFPNLARTGSTAYRKSAPDLVQHGTGPYWLNLVVTKDYRQPLLVTMAVSDLLVLMGFRGAVPSMNVRVQVKAREKSWIGRLHRELREQA